jgi:hypothetical protein
VEMSGTEKRERGRISLLLPIEYLRIDSDFRLIGYLQRGYTLNASENGLMVASRGEIPVDSDVRIRLFFCYPNLRCVETLSHVIWGVKREKNRDYLSGLRIVTAGEEDLRKWKEFMDNLFRSLSRAPCRSPLPSFSSI